MNTNLIRNVIEDMREKARLTLELLAQHNVSAHVHAKDTAIANRINSWADELEGALREQRVH